MTPSDHRPTFVHLGECVILESQHQSFCIGKSSDPVVPDFSVPQGSVLGPTRLYQSPPQNNLEVRVFQANRVVQKQRSILLSSSFLLLLRCLFPQRTSITFGGQKCTSTDQVFTAYLWGTERYWPPRKLGRYHDINLETISDGY